jgi:hypothetical protein
VLAKVINGIIKNIQNIKQKANLCICTLIKRLNIF